jgi:hypothetical protein
MQLARFEVLVAFQHTGAQVVCASCTVCLFAILTSVEELELESRSLFVTAANFCGNTLRHPPSATDLTASIIVHCICASVVPRHPNT